MGKGKKKTSVKGGAAASTQHRHAVASSAGGLVVVNPMLLQSMAAQSQSSTTREQLPSQPKSKKRKSSASTTTGNTNSKRKKSKPAAKAEQPSLAAPRSAVRPTVLTVPKAEHALVGLYWLLLAREPSTRHCVVAVSNRFAKAPSQSPSQLASMLKSLGLAALAIHSKMTPSQRQQAVQRLRDPSAASASANSSSKESVVLVTTEHLLASATCADADLLVLSVDDDGGNGRVLGESCHHKFARVLVARVGSPPSSDDDRESAFAPALSAAMTQRLHARLRLAAQIATLTERLAHVAADARDADAKWANKLARGADLMDEDEKNQSKSKSSKRPSPDEQRLQALTEKLCVLLAQPLGIHSADASASSSSAAAAAASTTTSDTQQHRSEKLKLLGIVTLSAAVGAAVHDDRLSAQTQWLDAADGAAFGGDWVGAVRHGASKDATSLALRREVCACHSSSSAPSSFLAQWRPNREPADMDAWGGAYGKVCGHNEVVMQRLRPFFPQEVLNSRVCSARFPAPGNRGFDGCLEFLRLATMHSQRVDAAPRALTVWDAESFLFFTPDGRVTAVKKTALLALPLAGLQCLLQAMRQWTLLAHGQLGPQTTLLAIRLCCAIGAGDVAVARLATESDRDGSRVVRRILSFAIGGSQRVWRQIARLPLPLERDVLYA